MEDKVIQIKTPLGFQRFRWIENALTEEADVCEVLVGKVVQNFLEEAIRYIWMYQLSRA